MTEDDASDEESERTEERTTAPQSEYTARDIAVGAAIAFVGLLLTFGVPLLLA